jgi:hypothetical protein
MANVLQLVAVTQKTPTRSAKAVIDLFGSSSLLFYLPANFQSS